MPYELLMTDAEFEQLIEANPFGFGSARQAHAVIGDRSVIVKKTTRAFGGSNYIVVYLAGYQRDGPRIFVWPLLCHQHYRTLPHDGAPRRPP